MFSGIDKSYQDTTITNDGFWPDLHAGEFEKRRGIPAAQDADNITYAIVAAIEEVNPLLATLKANYMADGFTKASEVTGKAKIDDKNGLEIQYERAVFARAKADLLPDIATLSQRDAGNNIAERSHETRSELLGESQRIIRNMLGQTRATVDLL